MGKYARCELHQRQHWAADNQTDRVRGHHGPLHRALRAQVLAEEERCRNPFCVRPFDNPTIDFIVPLSRGGEQTRENSQRLCLSCNSSRHDKPWSEFLAWEAERARLRGGSGGYAR
jgi:5-methylcytosine-specific restriction endonuclease McrA